MNFKELIQLCEGDNSKIFVVDEAGDVKLVVMGAVEFQGLLMTQAEQEVIDTETINREILKAQLVEVETAPLAAVKVNQSPDLRSEVIDPTFDFDSPEEVEIDGL